MLRWIGVAATVVIVAYFSVVRESEARCFRRKPVAAACAPPSCANPCAQAVAASVPATEPTTVVPPPAKPKPVSPKPVTPPAPTPPSVKPTTTAKLYALILVDDGNKENGPANKAGAALFEKMLKDGVPASRLGEFWTLSGLSLTHDKIRDTLATMPIQADDTIVCFFSGAATFDEAAKTFMLSATAGGQFPRAELRAELLLQKARLTVFITDAPAHRVQPENVPVLPDTGGPFQLEGLFFRHKGLVDVHAAAATENAFPRGNEGGMFTLALAQAAGRLNNADQAGAWSKLFEDAVVTTERIFRAYRQLVLDSDTVTAEEKRPYREQQTQTPTALSPIDQVVPATAAPKPAEIIVKAPAGAKLSIDGKPTRQSGATRRFETPELQPGKTYRYLLRLELHGRDSEQRAVDIRAGETVTVDFRPTLVVDRSSASKQ